MAQELRDRAAAADLPGYAEKLIRAAEPLETEAAAAERRYRRSPTDRGACRAWNAHVAIKHPCATDVDTRHG